MNGNLKAWCDDQMRMIESLQANIDILVQEHVPQLEQYHQQVSNIKISTSSEAALISKLTCILDTFGSTKFTKIIEHILSCKMNACKVSEKYQLTKDQLNTFLQLLKTHMQNV